MLMYCKFLLTISHPFSLSPPPLFFRNIHLKSSHELVIKSSCIEIELLFARLLKTSTSRSRLQGANHCAITFPTNRDQMKNRAFSLYIYRYLCAKFSLTRQIIVFVRPPEVVPQEMICLGDHAPFTC